jgi:hypothetical protein
MMPSCYTFLFPPPKWEVRSPSDFTMNVLGGHFVCAPLSLRGRRDRFFKGDFGRSALHNHHTLPTNLAPNVFALANGYVPFAVGTVS